MNKIKLTWKDIKKLATETIRDIEKYLDSNDIVFCAVKMYGIPRGGIFANQAIYAQMCNKCIESEIVDRPEDADIFIDDIIDTGATAGKYAREYKKPIFALINKQSETHKQSSNIDAWYVFPWENVIGETGPVENVRRLLEYIGENPNREGLLETPDRVIRSYDKLFGGYKQDPKDVLKVFTEGACDEMVLLKNIEFHSTCEHHMIPFTGRAHIAYCPDKKVIGISKLARLLEIYTRRLQIQERIGMQVTQALDELLEPKGSACIIEAQHLCMTARGVEKQNSVMVTSSLTGVFLEEYSTRNELLTLIKG